MDKFKWRRHLHYWQNNSQSLNAANLCERLKIFFSKTAQQNLRYCTLIVLRYVLLNNVQINTQSSSLYNLLTKFQDITHKYVYRNLYSWWHHMQSFLLNFYIWSKLQIISLYNCYNYNNNVILYNINIIVN